MRRSDNEDGAIGLVLLAAAVVLMMLTLAVVAGGQLLSGRARAQAAADAAALAAAPVTFRPFNAAGSPAEEAARFAAANEAVLTRCACALDPSWEPRTVVVAVRHRVRVVLFGTTSVGAVAHAEFVPTRLLE